MKKDIEISAQDVKIEGSYGSVREFVISIENCDLGEVLDQVDSSEVFEYISDDLSASEVVRNMNDEDLLDAIGIDLIKDYLAENHES